MEGGMIYRTPEQQQQRLLECLSDTTCKVTFWCSDQWGGPANHQCDSYGAEWRAYPGRVDDIGGEPEVCSSRALHGTDFPHQWRGMRVWVVGLWNWVEDENKYAATRREIICELAPEFVISQSVAARMQLRGANLYCADLRGADLRGANLRDANLYGADLRGADLRGADLRGTNLRGANLRDANLYGAYLYGAYLRDADLRGADLYGADLYGAYLSGADLRDANLRGFTKLQRIDFAARGALFVDVESE